MPRKTTPPLDSAAVGALLGVRAATISQYRRDSRPGGRYADRPFPEPSGAIGGRAPYWDADRADEIRRWHAGRRTQGWAAKPKPVSAEVAELRAERLALGLSLRGLAALSRERGEARLAKLTDTIVAAWEQGRKQPRAESLAEWRACLAVARQRAEAAGATPEAAQA